MAELKLRNIHKVYDEKAHIVKGVDLEINDKEFVVLVGPSGCGKSTILRMIAGLEDITYGELLIDNQVVNNIEAKDRDIAMVFQNYALYPHMTVEKNIAFGLKLRKESKQEIKEKVLEVAKILGLDQHLNKKPSQLSGGQKQRVALGRAMVRSPKAFLMDEPLSNLDAKLRNSMRAELCKLHEKLNTTFIYVTHDQTEAMTMGDKIVVLNNGCIQQCGDPGEIYNNPTNIFVASFIGSPQINFIDGKIIKDNNDYIIDCDFLKINLNKSFPNIIGNIKENEGREVKIGIRPEDIHFSMGDKDTLLSEPILMKIDNIENLGHEFNIFLNNEKQSVVGKYSGGKVYTLHDKIDVYLNLKKVLLFDKESGQRIS